MIVKVQQYIKTKTVTNNLSMLKTWLVLAICLLVNVSGYSQQNSLSRVSAAERSDGKGYVIRYHLTEEADSFRVFQPTTDLIQMTLYGESVDTTDITVAGSNGVFDDISFYDIPFGIGVDIYLPDSTYFKAKSYPDGNSEDLLLALTYAERKEIAYLTDGLDPVIWPRLSNDDNDMLVETNRNIQNVSSRDYTDNTYDRVKNKMKFDVVVIDPGHGGRDVGAIGYKGVQEKDIVLNIAKKVGDYIKEYLPDVKVVYTRDDDTFIDLEQRGPLANKAEGDLFVSIHANKFHNKHPHGTETYFLGLEKSKSALEVMKRENNVINGDGFDPDKVLSPEELLVYELQNSGYIATSEKLAGMVENQFADRAQRKSRGVKQGRLVVLYQASMPAILVETGFLSNPSEQRFLSSDYGQSIIASAIFRAIRNYKEEYEKSQHFNTN